jgi:hypothetical protein
MKEFTFHGFGYYETEDITIWAEDFSSALRLFMEFHSRQDDEVKMLHLAWKEPSEFHITIEHIDFAYWDYYVNPEGTDVKVEEKVAFFSFCTE